MRYLAMLVVGSMLAFAGPIASQDKGFEIPVGPDLCHFGKVAAIDVAAETISFEYEVRQVSVVRKILIFGDSTKTQSDPYDWTELKICNPNGTLILPDNYPKRLKVGTQVVLVIGGKPGVVFPLIKDNVPIIHLPVRVVEEEDKKEGK